MIAAYPIYSARGVLGVIARTLKCDAADIESRLEQRFEVKIPRHVESQARLDAIRKKFNPGEGNDIIQHIYELTKNG